MKLLFLLARVAKACGEDVAVQLASRLGGVDVVIYPTFTANHPFCQVFPEDVAARVAAALGPGKHYIPRLVLVEAAARAERIRNAGKTLSVTQIALREGVSVRRVYQLRRGLGQ